MEAIYGRQESRNPYYDWIALLHSWTNIKRNENNSRNPYYDWIALLLVFDFDQFPKEICRNPYYDWIALLPGVIVKWFKGNDMS